MLRVLPFFLLVSTVYAAPGQSIALDVIGPAANAGKAGRCIGVAVHHGITIDSNAPVHVTLTLASGNNHLKVTSRHGTVVDEPRPGWGMDQLCEDAMQVAERAYAGNTPAPMPHVAPGSGTALAIDVVGSASNPGKVQRCIDAANRRGVVVSAGAAMHITLTLESGHNRLQIQNRRGTLYDQPKPGWGMEQLCDDAITQALAVGPAAPPPPAPVSTTPPPPAAKPHKGALVLGPIPPPASLPPNIKSLADSAIGAWQNADFIGARNFFREAEQQSQDPQFLYDEAVCEQRIDESANALHHVQEFLKAAPDSAYKPYALQLKSELQGR